MEIPFQNNRNYSELEIQHAWNLLECDTALTCTDGREIVVLYPGRWNFEGGPDFLNARIKISGAELSGDVEIHNSPSDWFLHGHDSNAKYNNVILHVVRSCTDSDAASSKFPHKPTVIFPDSYLPVFSRYKKNKDVKKYSGGLCADSIKRLEHGQFSRLLCSLGNNRLSKKSIVFINEILADGAEQSFLIHIFEAFGYKNNRQAFMNLYKRFSIYDISDYDDLKFESAIWGESGLLPSKGVLKCDNQMQAYIASLWSYWWKLNKDMTNVPKVVWEKSAGRPVNTPWRRIAGLLILLKKLSPSPLKYLLTILNQSLSLKEIIGELINIFSCEDEILGSYSSFNKKLEASVLLIGRSRAIEIIGNIVIPFFYAYSKINRDNNLEKRLLRIWEEFPPSKSNNISFRISFERWGVCKDEIKKIVKSFSAEQGVIFIYKNLCEYLQMNCEECPVYRNLKN